jgi:hypothetical protein
MHAIFSAVANHTKWLRDGIYGRVGWGRPAWSCAAVSFRVRESQRSVVRVLDQPDQPRWPSAAPMRSSTVKAASAGPSIGLQVTPEKSSLESSENAWGTTLALAWGTPHSSPSAVDA